MRTTLLVLLILIGGGMAYVRLAPSDPARWHVMPEREAGGGPGGTDPVETVAGGAHAVLWVADAAPADILARLDAIALATPRTRRLAGAPDAGMITWITRSALFGFPDYTTATARAEGTASVLALHARQRFGLNDLGVNAARLRDWLARLADG